MREVAMCPRMSRVVFCAAIALTASPRGVLADAAYQPLPFFQDWSNTAMITVDDDWSGVAGIIGYLGNHYQGWYQSVDPRSLLSNESPSDTVMANRSEPSTLAAGGVAEFDGIPNPVVALQADYRADAPYLQIHLNTVGYRAIDVSCVVRDLDGSPDDAVQQVVLQFRVDRDMRWQNLLDTYVSDATHGPSLATLVTPIRSRLPASCENTARVQLRIMTTDAPGQDEWIGVDDIEITGTPIAAGEFGVNLDWDRCAGGTGPAERTFGCDDRDASIAIVGSFRTDIAIPDFVGVSAVVDIVTNELLVPPWFQFGFGGCREGALGVHNVPSLVGCASPYAGAAFQGGGMTTMAGSTPGTVRIWLDWVRDSPGPVSTGELNAAFVLRLGTDRTWDEGFGSCDGCRIPARVALRRVEVYSLSLGRLRILETADARAWVGWQGGGALVTGPTPARRTSWGQVKALYR